MGTRNRKKETEVGRGVGLMKSRGGAQVTEPGREQRPGPHSPITQRRGLRSQAGKQPHLTPCHPFYMNTHLFRKHRLYSDNIGLGPAPCH